MLPLTPDDGSSTLVVLFVSDPHGDDGRALEQQVRSHMPRARVVYVDRRSAPLEADAIAAMLPKYKRVIAALYTVPQPGQVGSQTSLDQKTGALVLQNILAGAADRTAVLAMGSPYPILDYPTIRTYVCAFSSVSTSEVAMARALFGQIPMRGKLPVTLPGVARVGEGIDLGSR
jgi:beta-N-acetylhexosaminidase